MALFGLVKGIIKTAGGIITGDGEMLAKGLKKTAVNGVFTVIELANGGIFEKAHEDKDDDL